MHTPDFFSIKEFAAFIGVHPDTIRRSIRRGRIAAIKVGGGKRSIFRIPKSETQRLALCDLEEIVEKMIEKRSLNNPQML